MKLIKYLITVLIISSIMLTSCKKYTCECTAQNLNLPGGGATSTFTVKKRDKKKLCTDKSTQADNYGNFTTCIIK
jgi:hypothetical protein